MGKERERFHAKRSATPSALPFVTVPLRFRVHEAPPRTLPDGVLPGLRG